MRNPWIGKIVILRVSSGWRTNRSGFWWGWIVYAVVASAVSGLFLRSFLLGVLPYSALRGVDELRREPTPRERSAQEAAKRFAWEFIARKPRLRAQTWHIELNGDPAEDPPEIVRRKGQTFWVVSLYAIKSGVNIVWTVYMKRSAEGWRLMGIDL